MPTADSTAADSGLTGTIEIAEAFAPGCETLAPPHCLLPFPSDALTVADDTTPTGRRVALPADGMPANVDGERVDPTEWNRADGFSPNAVALVHTAGVDVEASGLPPVTDIGASLASDAPSVLIDADTGERVPHWVELDANAASDDERLLTLRPARALVEGHRHVVALRGLVDRAGEPIAPSDVFRAYRDRLDTGVGALEARRPAMESVFADLEAAGIGRDDLVVAWDFTVASEASTTGRLVALRQEAFAQLGDAAPAFAVDDVHSDGAARVVDGTFTVPSALSGDGGPGSTLVLDDAGRPRLRGTLDLRFLCVVPDAATAAVPVSLYGHGLLGSADEVLGIGSVAAATGRALCATDWIGMSSADVGVVSETLADLSGFPTLPDRLLHAHLAFLFLGRLVTHPDGFASDPAFQSANGTPLLDGDRLTFVGASQGGILGGATTAVATDWDRAALVVGASNYSLLLQRSIDFDPFAAIFEPAYPDGADRMLLLALVQMLWDRGENGGYAQHLTADPLEGSGGPKTVLLFEAFGDHQVANVATESLARTLGLPVHRPTLAEGRSTDVEPQWGLDPIPDDPYTGSALVVWDFGAPPPPVTNTPPRAGDDPHGAAGSDPAALALLVGFLDGGLEDVCGGSPCAS